MKHTEGILLYTNMLSQYPVTTLIGSNVGDVLLQRFMNASEEKIIEEGIC